MQPSPGYWRTKRILERMRRLQDLIRHGENWGGDIALAEPLEKLLPNVAKERQHIVLDQEITKLLRVVYWDLKYGGVDTEFIYGNTYGPLDKDTKRFRLPLDYPRLPREPGREHLSFQAMMRVLNDGLGVYEARLLQARRELFNPIIWAAHLIRLPITVMERAGFVGHEKTEELMLGGYVRFVKIIMSVILVLVALLLGVKVPWAEIVSSVLKWVLG
jgi:hypothetical protein